MCEEYDYDFIRMPALGPKALTILEAKLDSAKTLMHMPKPKYDKVDERIKHCLRIVRNAIEEEKRATNPEFLIKRCTYRETKRTRCNKSPVKAMELDDERTVYRCKTHYKPLLRGVEPEVVKE